MSTRVVSSYVRQIPGRGANTFSSAAPARAMITGIPENTARLESLVAVVRNRRRVMHVLLVWSLRAAYRQSPRSAIGRGDGRRGEEGRDGVGQRVFVCSLQ